jgi:dTDP-4-amino-4,6-dideoxygalactose transaminase
MGDSEKQAVARVIDTGVLSTGPEVAKFEKAVSDYLSNGALTCVATNSATSAFELIFKAMGLGPDDEVIFPALTYLSPAMEAHKLGATVVIADVNPNTLCLDAESIAHLVTSKTRAVVPTHFAGYPLDTSRDLRIYMPTGCQLIDDAAHAFGAALDGYFVGDQYADAAIFSFYATKPVAVGEGGMLVLREPHTFRFGHRLKELRLHGVSKLSSCPDRHWDYEALTIPGAKANMTDLAAAIGLQQLKRVWEMQSRRTEIAARYNLAFSRVTCVELPPAPPAHSIHTRHLYQLYLRNCMQSDGFISEMYRKGIVCSKHYKPLNWIFSKSVDQCLVRPICPVAQDHWLRSVSLPIFSSMTDDQVELVISAVKQTLEG